MNLPRFHEAVLALFASLVGCRATLPQDPVPDLAAQTEELDEGSAPTAVADGEGVSDADADELRSMCRSSVTSACARLGEGCRSGEVTACYALGEGCDVEQDDACVELARSCRSGSAAACIVLVPPPEARPERFAEAATILRAACPEHPRAACGPLVHATLAETAEADRALARSHLERACEQDGAACLELVQSLGGTGELPSDRPRAFTFLERACERGLGDACTVAADWLATGHGVAVDAARARAMASRACTDDELSGCWPVLSQPGLPRAGSEEVRAAVATIRRACAAGRRAGCVLLRRARAMGEVSELSDADLEAMFAARCVPTEQEDCAPLWSEDEGGDPSLPFCGSGAPLAGDARARTALRNRLARKLRAGVVVASELGAGELSLLLRTLGPRTCDELPQRLIVRWIRPLARDADRSLLAVVEWFAEQDDGGILHESVLRLSDSELAVTSDEGFFWQYTSMGLAAWQRSTQNDLDADGVPDVALRIFEGFDDANTSHWVVVTSRARRVQRVQVEATEIFSTRACFVPSPAGPMLFASVQVPGRAQESTRSCLAGVAVEHERGLRALRLAATLGEEASVSPPDHAEDPDAPMRALAPNAALVGFGPLVFEASEALDEASGADVEAFFRTDTRSPSIAPCPARFAFALVATPPWSSGDPQPTRVRIATSVEALDANEARATPWRSVTFPQDEMPPLCDVLY